MGSRGRTDAEGQTAGIQRRSRQTGHDRLRCPHYEPGSDGVRWAFTTDYSTATRPFQNLHILHDGDTLTIYAEDASVRWSGVISLEYDTGWRTFTHRGEPDFGQQEVGGFWVNGVQRGWTLADWADLFFGHEVALPAVRETVRALPLKAVLVATP